MKKWKLATQMLTVLPIGLPFLSVSCGNNSESSQSNDVMALLKNEMDKIDAALSINVLSLTNEENNSTDINKILLDKLNELISLNVSDNCVYSITNIKKVTNNTTVSFTLKLNFINDNDNFIEEEKIIEYVVEAQEDNDAEKRKLLEDEANKIVTLLNKENLTLNLEQDSDDSWFQISIKEKLETLINENIDSDFSFEIRKINKSPTRNNGKILVEFEIFYINDRGYLVNKNANLNYTVLTQEEWINQEKEKVTNIISSKEISLTEDEEKNLDNKIIEWYLGDWLHGQLDGWFSYELKEFTKDETNKEIKITITLIFIGDEGDIENDLSFNVKYNVYKVDVNSFFDNIVKNVKLIPNSSYPKLNYKEITAKKYSKLNAYQQKYYLMPNEDELLELEKNNQPLFKNLSILWKIDNFNWKKPREITFEITIELSLPNLKLTKTKNFIISDFKEDNSLIGELDAKENVILKTPNGAVSYKGELEKFLISDIGYLSTTSYKKYVQDFSFDQYKMEMMYQVRFALYQMFSDNFTEINYYYKEENNGIITFTGEAIIKEDAPKTRYYFQPYLKNRNGYVNIQYPLIRESNLKKGDRIKINMIYDPSKIPDGIISGEKWKPLHVDSNWNPELGENTPLYTYFWNFQKGMNPMIDNSITNPLFVNHVYKILLGNNEGRFEIYVNGNKTYSEKSGTFFTFSFVLRKKNPDYLALANKEQFD
ncbi:MAG: hypothetical protein HDR43_00665 [Mycoplasma sp.]|nr:hypothetical protein [Mycoplasma sp.]